MGDDTAVLTAITKVGAMLDAAKGELKTDLNAVKRELKEDVQTVHKRVSDLADKHDASSRNSEARLAVLERIELNCPVDEMNKSLVTIEATANGRRKEAARVSAIVASVIAAIGALGTLVGVAVALSNGGGP